MPNKVYTQEHLEYLREISEGRYNDEITKMFNKKFNQDRTESAIRTLRTRHKIKSNVSPVKTEYTKEHIEYVKELCSKGLFNSEIKERFNKKFNLNKSERAIKSLRGKYKIRTSARKQWKKGHEPWNKGKKGYMGPNKTSFKKGNFSYNRVPLGSERITKDGYIQIKVKDGEFQNNWKGKHIIEWEKNHGEVPEGHVVIFGDGNQRNFDIDNLILVDRHQLLLMNQHKLIKDDAELTKTGVQIANVYKKISESKRRV